MVVSTPAAAPLRRWLGAGRIASAADIEHVLADLTGASGRRANTREALRAATTARDADRGPGGYLPVHAALAPLLPWIGGLRRGATVTATGGNSLILALLGAATAGDGWAAVVGMPELGMLAAIDQGILVDRVALVPAPGPDWPAVTSALLDGMDLVVIATPGEVAAGTARALSARARHRGAVLVPTRPWPGADLTLTITAHRHAGLRDGHGVLDGHEVTVRATGRGSAAQPREVTVPVPLPPAGARPVRHLTSVGVATDLPVEDPANGPYPLPISA